MAMSFNEFQRELIKRDIGGPIALVLTEMYEQIREQATQLDSAMKVLNQIATAMQGIVGLHEHTQSGLRELQARINGEVSGVSLSSVPLRDED